VGVEDNFKNALKKAIHKDPIGYNQMLKGPSGLDEEHDCEKVHPEMTHQKWEIQQKDALKEQDKEDKEDKEGKKVDWDELNKEGILKNWSARWPKPPPGWGHNVSPADCICKTGVVMKYKYKPAVIWVEEYIYAPNVPGYRTPGPELSWTRYWQQSNIYDSKLLSHPFANYTVGEAIKLIGISGKDVNYREDGMFEKYKEIRDKICSLRRTLDHMAKNTELKWDDTEVTGVKEKHTNIDQHGLFAIREMTDADYRSIMVDLCLMISDLETYGELQVDYEKRYNKEREEQNRQREEDIRLHKIKYGEYEGESINDVILEPGQVLALEPGQKIVAGQEITESKKRKMKIQEQDKKREKKRTELGTDLDCSNYNCEKATGEYGTAMMAKMKPWPWKYEGSIKDAKILKPEGYEEGAEMRRRGISMQDDHAYLFNDKTIDEVMAILKRAGTLLTQSEIKEYACYLRLTLLSMSNTHKIKQNAADLQIIKQYRKELCQIIHDAYHKDLGKLSYLHPDYVEPEWETAQKEVEEATTSASAGAFMAPLGYDPRFTKKKKDKKEEFDEATGASSAGAYVTPQMWAKDEKNWRGKAKTTWPGGKFVKVKKKCGTFPYCNQGDINALELTDNKMVKAAIQEITKKTGKDKKYIKELVKKEIEEIIRRSIYKSPITSLLGPKQKMNTPIGKIYTMGSNVGGKYE